MPSSRPASYHWKPEDETFVWRVARAYAGAGATATRGMARDDVRPYLKGCMAELAAHRLMGLPYEPSILSAGEFHRVSRASRRLHSDVAGRDLDIKASAGRKSWFVLERTIDDAITYVGAVVDRRATTVRFYGGSSGAVVRSSRRPLIAEVPPERIGTIMENRMLVEPFEFAIADLLSGQMTLFPWVVPGLSVRGVS